MVCLTFVYFCSEHYQLRHPITILKIGLYNLSSTLAIKGWHLLACYGFHNSVDLPIENLDHTCKIEAVMRAITASILCMLKGF